MSFIKLFDEVNKEEIELVGGKALSLSCLVQAGLPVPPGFVITTDAYKNLSGEGISSDFKKTVLGAFDNLGVERVAVRSSAIAEDSSDASWAGQFESYINVNREQLIDSVVKCWKSASSDTVNAYAEGKSTDKEQLAIAVVVQKMVKSEVSGVAFSVNPVTKDTAEIMIEAIYGLGELLVQGMITPDNYVVDKHSFEVKENVTKAKSTMLVYKDGKNVEQPVPEDQVDKSCLTDQQIVELSKLINKIELYYGSAQDIEWALEDNKFYIVQSRPITTLK